MEDKEFEIVENVPIIRKANPLILSKFKLTLFENQIYALSLSKLEEDGNQLTSVLYSGEIRRLLGKMNDRNIYAKLKTLETSMKSSGNVVHIDDGKGNFKIFAMITNVEYENGVLNITYNKELTPYLWSLSSQFTTLSLSILLSFENNHAYRLYEILKKECYRLDKNEGKGIRVDYNLNELRCMLGLVDIDKEYLQKAMRSGKYNWDELVEQIAKPEDKQYMTYYEFKRFVLNVAQKELKAKGDICFDYEAIKGNRKKVIGISFVIYSNEASETVIQTIEEKKKAIETTETKLVNREMIVNAYNDTLEYLQNSGISNTSSFTMEYFQKLYKVAGNSLKAIRDAIDYGTTIDNIRNYYAWLYSAVKEGYSESVQVETLHGSTDRADMIRDIMNSEPTQEQYDRMWCKRKESDEDLIRDMLEEYALDMDMFEDMYTAKERIKMVIDYRMRAVHRD